MEEKQEFWAIVGLFGHQKIAGKISEQVIAAPFIRIDVPETSVSPSFTRFVSPSAIYDINPVTEEVARAYADRLQVKPIESWDAREVLRRMDEAKKLAPAAMGESDDDEVDFD